MKSLRFNGFLLSPLHFASGVSGISLMMRFNYLELQFFHFNIVEIVLVRKSVEQVLFNTRFNTLNTQVQYTKRKSPIQYKVQYTQYTGSIHIQYTIQLVLQTSPDYSCCKLLQTVIVTV